ncbi:hypothetical protein Tco_0564781 [Tanacetum coccineum]
MSSTLFLLTIVLGALILEVSMFSAPKKVMVVETPVLVIGIVVVTPLIIIPPSLVVVVVVGVVVDVVVILLWRAEFNPTAPSVPLNFMGSHFMNSEYEQPLTSGTVFIATTPTVHPLQIRGSSKHPRLAPFVFFRSFGYTTDKLQVCSSCFSQLLSGPALATSAALAVAAVHSAAIATSTLSTIIRSITALLILFGGMILLITKM